MNRQDAPPPSSDHPHAAMNAVEPAAADPGAQPAAAAPVGAAPGHGGPPRRDGERDGRFDHAWQPLPSRAWQVFQLVGLLTATPPALLLWWLAARRLPAPWDGWSWLLGLAVLLWAAWLSHKRHRWTFWTLDADGFAVRRGRIWQWETRVPMGRVQHIDLKRGPLERAFGLASLVVHTAGTRLAGLDLSGVDLADAERVRDLLAREVERQRRREGDDEDGDEGEDEGDADASGDADGLADEVDGGRARADG